MKLSELIAVPMQPVKKSRNIHSVSWHGGYVVVKFFSGSALYVYGSGIPQQEMDKILRVPFPDAIFQSNIKARYKCHKVEIK